jgi:hypothetical protein
MYNGGQKISSVIFPSFQKNRCSPFLIVMTDVFTFTFESQAKCHWYQILIKLK